MQLFKKTNIDFMGMRHYAYALSLAMVIAGVISLVVKGGPRLGIDFTGGSLVQIGFEKPVNMGELRNVLSENGHSDAELQSAADSKTVMIRIPKSQTGADKLSVEVHQILVTKMPGFVSTDTVKAIERAEYVGPAVGRTLTEQAQSAVFWAIALIIVYVAFRFRSWVWGFCSIAAMLHDVLSVVGLFSMMNKEITVTVVAGILTLAGYSMNDTIVIYDRMRENLRLSRKESLSEIINRSINETLSRTFMTSISVMITLVVLFFFGGEVIHDFAFAMLWGVVIGTYSSIFVAAPLIYEWTKLKNKPAVHR